MHAPLALRALVFLILCVVAAIGTVDGRAAPLCPGCPEEDPLRGRQVITLFYRGGEALSEQTKRMLAAVTESLYYLELVVRDVEVGNHGSVHTTVAVLHGVDEAELTVLPAAFLAGDAFIGVDSIRQGMRSFVNATFPEAQGLLEHLYFGALRLKVNALLIVDSLVWLAVVAAGLLDGVNPCSLSILIFLLAYLLYAGQGRRNVWLLGGCFSLGIFIAYFSLGIGLLQFLSSAWFHQFHRWFYPVLGLTTLFLGICSLVDVWRIRSGRPSMMILQMPKPLQQLAHRYVRRLAGNSRATMAVAFSTGMVITIFEFPCTGQMYLPTLALIGSPFASSQSLFYLFVYNVMFVLPELLVIGVAAASVSADQVAKTYSKALGTIKLLSAVMFFLLATYYLWIFATYG